jgi:hypothetical protein
MINDIGILADLENAKNAATAAERAAVVTFLREQAEQWEKDGAGWAAMNHASVMIERGLHRGEER